jgi:hypothetical protein
MTSRTLTGLGALISLGLLPACSSSSGGTTATTDSGAPDASFVGPDGGEMDSAVDSGGGDGGVAESGTPEGSVPEASVPDAGGTDSGVVEGGSGDGGVCTPTTAGWNGGPVTISTGASCTLAQSIAANLTLSTSQCAVYDAPMGLSVGGTASPTLTIGPGVTVAFGSGTGLQVGSDSGGNPVPGGLVVQGTACSPVVFTSDVAVAPKAGDWGTAQLKYETLSTSSISNLIVQYAGGNDTGSPTVAASLLVNGTGGDFRLPLTNVTASNNYASGIVFLSRHTGPSSTSSGTLTVTDWPATADPFQIDADGAGMLAPVHLSTGSTPNGFVHLHPSNADVPTVSASEHWPSIAPLAYVLGETGDQDSLTIDSVGGTAAILTIDAPNTIRLGNDFLIIADYNVSGLGGLQANGTTANPIVFTSLSGLPQPGAWAGISLDYPGSVLSSLSYVTIDSAGSSINEAVTCGSQPAGGIALVYGSGFSLACLAAPTLSNITFTNMPSAAYGFLATNVSQATATALATTDGNTFPSSASAVFTCPEPAGSWQCGN